MQIDDSKSPEEKIEEAELAEKKEGDEENKEDKEKLIEDDVDKKEEDADGEKKEENAAAAEGNEEANNVKVADSPAKSRFVSMSDSSFNRKNIFTFIVVFLVPIVIEFMASSLQPVFSRQEVDFPVKDVIKCYKGS